jgi:hypothetical protein
MSQTPTNNDVRVDRISNRIATAGHSGSGACVERLEDRRLLSVAVPSQSSGAGAGAHLSATAAAGSDATPAIATIPNATLSATATFTYQVIASGSPAPTYSLSTAPSGMTIDNYTGLISWTPGVKQVGVQTVKVRASNSEGSGSASFKITVTSLAAPIVTIPATLTATAGGNFTYQVLTTGSAPTGFSLVSAPVGMTISATGLISWSPTSLGTQSLTVLASNAAGSSTGTFAITVVKDTVPPTAPTLTLGPITTTNSIPLSWSGSTDNVGVVGYRIFTYTPAVYRGHSGRGGGYTLVSPAKYTLLVDGITSTNYTITGLAPNSTHQYAVAAYDAAGNQSAYSAVLTGTTLLAPTLSWTYYGGTNVPLSDVADYNLTFYLGTTGSPAPTLSMISAPAGVVFTPGQITNSQLTYVTPNISWTPTPDEVGLNYITMQASNSVGTYTISIPVTVTPDTPQISVSLNGGLTYSAGQFASGQSNYVVTANPGFGNFGYPNPPIPQYALAGTPFNFQVTSASNAGPTTLSLVSGPAGLTLDPSTGIGTWTPDKTQGGNTTVIVTATNSAGTSTLHLNFPTYFTTAPGTPAATYTQTASGVGTNNPTLTWTAPADSTGLADYLITVTDAHTNVTTTIDTQSTATSYTLSGLGGQQYFVTVTPLDANGNAGIASPAMSIYALAVPFVSWTASTSTPTIGTPLTVQFKPNTSGLIYSIVSGPAGATIDPKSGLLLWTPTQSGDNIFTIAAAYPNGWGTVNAVLDILV